MVPRGQAAEGDPGADGCMWIRATEYLAVPPSQTTRAGTLALWGKGRWDGKSKKSCPHRTSYSIESSARSNGTFVP